MLAGEGERVQMTDMSASPDKEGCRRRVLGVSFDYAWIALKGWAAHSFESRYGTWVILRLDAISANFEMTNLSVNSLYCQL